MAQRILVTAPRTVEVRTIPDPPLEAGMATVRPTYMGISVGTELNTYRGGVNWHSGRDPQTGLFRRETGDGGWNYPASVGYANIGRVEALAPDVKTLAPGQMVFSSFSHQTPLTGPASRFLPIHDGQDPRKYLFFQLVRTALNVVHYARPVLGDTVAIFGLGAVGLITLQLVRRAGAGRVIAFDLLPKRRKMALSMGADAVGDPSEEDPAYFVRNHNHSRGADAAIECAASVRAIQDATRSVDHRGRVVMASMPNQPGSFHFGQEVHFGAVSITGANVMRPPHDLGPLWNLDRQADHARELIPHLDLLRLITHEFAFEKAAEAYALLDQNPPDVISVALRCS